MAKQYAEDASAKTNGGLLTGVTNGEEESAVNKAIFASPVNKLVGPIKGIFGWYVLEVTKSTPATQESLAKATPTIKLDCSPSQEQTKAEAKVTASQEELEEQDHLPPAPTGHRLLQLQGAEDDDDGHDDSDDDADRHRRRPRPTTADDRHDDDRRRHHDDRQLRTRELRRPGDHGGARAPG